MRLDLFNCLNQQKPQYFGGLDEQVTVLPQCWIHAARQPSSAALQL